jgi:hypothetical protein
VSGTLKNDLTGKRFAHLFVIGRAENSPNSTQPRWLCKCDCGREKIVWGNGLYTGSTKSCGCSTKALLRCTSAKPGAALRIVLRSYKYGAFIRSIKWLLTNDDFARLSREHCHYCDLPPSKVTVSRSGERYTWNGIDRLNSDLDYTPDNCVACCSFCNAAKNVLSPEEFVQRCLAVVKFSLKGFAL